MNFNDLLQSKDIDPHHVLVLRHRPPEREFRKKLPWLAVKSPDLFNAYQQTQSERLERAMAAMAGVGYIGSFIGQEAGKATFIGLYSIGKSKPLSYNKYWKVPENIELKSFGMKGFTGEKRSSVLWFDLALIADFYASWKGKLIVNWPPPELAWWRRVHRNDIPVHAILEDSVLDPVMPEWNAIDLTWDDLRILPKNLESALLQWRGVYYIFDTSDGKGYVGSAYGKDNLRNRWKNYAASGDGGNRLLKRRDPHNFRFSILKLVAPDTDPADVIRLETSWKERLHTRKPYGLNDN
jgi:hypothetical protein